MNTPRKKSYSLRKRSVLLKTFAILLGLSFFTLIICTAYLSHIIFREKDDNISELSMGQLIKTKDEIDSVITVLSSSLSGNLWSNDNLDLLLSLDMTDQPRNTRIVDALRNSMEQNPLVISASLYSAKLDYVFLSSGIWQPLKDHDKQAAIYKYLEIRTPYTASEDNIQLHLYDRQLYLCFDLETPIYVGTLFYRLDLDAFSDMVHSGGDQILVMTPENRLLFGNPPEDFSLTDSNYTWITPEVLASDGYKVPASHAYYSVTSEKTGWTYLYPVDSTGVTDYVPEIITMLIPFMLIYALACVAISYRLSRGIYRPIHTLLRITDTHKSASDQHWEDSRDETAFLEKIYEETFDENIQYQQALDTISVEVHEQLIRKLLMGRNLSREYLEETLRLTSGQHLLHARFIVLAVLLDLTEVENEASVEWVMFRQSLLKLIRDTLPHPEHTYLTFMEEDRLAVVLAFPKTYSVTEIKHLSSELKNQMENAFTDTPTNLYWGSSRVIEDISGLLSSWQLASEAAMCQRYAADSPVEEVNTMPTVAPIEKAYLSEKLKICMDLSSDNKREECEEMFRLLFDELFSQSREPSENHRMLELMQDTIIENLLLYGVELNDIEQLADKWDIHQQPESQSDEEHAMLLRSFTWEALRLIQINGRKNRFKYVDEAVEYISRHYMNSSLSLESVSDYIGITPTYLSTLFKEIKKEKFNTYLNSYRVEQAKILLKNTTMSNADIGYKCGFNSNQTFYRVFKKITEVTPNQYRELQKKGEM